LANAVWREARRSAAAGCVEAALGLANRLLVYAKRPKLKKMLPHGIRVTANPLQPARTKSTFGSHFFHRFAD